MILVLCAVLSAAPETIQLPARASNDSNGFQVLGLSAEAAAVREVRQFGDEDPASVGCAYPIDAQLTKGRDDTELPDGDKRRWGVTLWKWRLPDVGHASLATGESFVVYRSVPKKNGCTPQGEASAALESAKASFTASGIDVVKPPARVAFGPREFDRWFSKGCYATPGKAEGCTVTNKGKLGGEKLVMTTTQLAKSDCVATPDDVATIGCTVSSRFQGTIELGGTKTDFHVLTPALDSNAQLRLESAAVWKAERATVAALYFTWVYNGRFERTAVLVRLR